MLCRRSFPYPSPHRLKLAAALLSCLLAGLAAPAAARGQSTVTVQMVGAGTLDLVTQGAGEPLRAACPLQPPLANPDSGPPLQVCAPRWSPVCTPAAGAASCALTVQATARLPGAPELTPAEEGGWILRGWTAGPCADTRTTTCTFPIGSCTTDGTCAYEDVTLGIAFDDRRAPAAVFVDTPPAVDEAPGGRATFTFRSNEYSGQEVSTFQCRLDSGVWAACPGPPGTHAVTVADGPHTMQVRAIDPSGNVQSSGIPLYRWTQQTPPTPVFDSGPQDGAALNVTSATFTFHAHPRATFECRLDAGDFAPCESPFTADELADGRHELSVRATRTDTDPDRSATATRSWSVDTVAPESIILSGPEDGTATTSRSATFTFRSEPIGDPVRFECALDAALPAPCDPAGTTYSGLAAGSHEVVVTAIDEAGNREESGPARAWTVVVDNDADGFSDDDCDDANAAVNPGVPDPAGDNVDQDCDGIDGSGFDFGSDAGFGTDADFDGDPAPPEGGDCDDANPMASSFGEEVPENGVDDDCDGEDALKRAIGLRLSATWRVTRSGSRLLALDARKVPGGTVLRITCRRRCPVRVKHVQVGRPRERIRLLSYFGGRLRLPVGAVLEVRATKAGRSPEGRTWRVRRGRPPATAAFCEHSKRREPGRC